MHPFFSLLFPNCCAICHLRQDQTICHICLHKLIQHNNLRKCILCACLCNTLLCKYCLHAKPAFDQTITLCYETSFLISLIRRCDLRGSINVLPSLYKAWEVINFRNMTPVDFIIPLPEKSLISQKRGFWFALELTKYFSQLAKTPYNKDLIIWKDKNPSLFELNNKFARSFFFHNKRIAIVMPYFLSEMVLNNLAKLLKAHGVVWVSYWVLTKNSKKEFY